MGLLWSPSDFFIVYVVCGLDGAQQYHFPHFYLSFWSYINWPTSNWFIPTQFLDKKQRIAPDDYLVLGPCRSRLNYWNQRIFAKIFQYIWPWKRVMKTKYWNYFNFLFLGKKKETMTWKKIASHTCAYYPFSCFISNSIKTPKIAAALAWCARIPVFG